MLVTGTRNTRGYSFRVAIDVVLDARGMFLVNYDAMITGVEGVVGHAAGNRWEGVVNQLLQVPGMNWQQANNNLSEAYELARSVFNDGRLGEACKYDKPTEDDDGKDRG